MDQQLPIIDWEQHAQAGSATHDMSKELLMLFIQQLPELEERLQNAFAQQNIEDLHSVFHRLQGACAYCGLPRLRNLTGTITHTLKRDAQLSAEQYNKILQAINQVKEELAKHGITI